MLIVLTCRNHSANLLDLKLLCENQCFLWTPPILSGIHIFYSRQQLWWQNMRTTPAEQDKEHSLTERLSRRLACFQSRSLLTSTLNLSMPSLWFIRCHCCALTEKKKKKKSSFFFFLFCLLLWCALIIFPFARLSEVIPFQSSRSQYL